MLNKYFQINNLAEWNQVLSKYIFQVLPGETALAFYTAMNPTDKTVTGIATYNIVPFEAGKYFNKIQVFKIYQFSSFFFFFNDFYLINDLKIKYFRVVMK